MLLALAASVERLCEWSDEQKLASEGTWLAVGGARVRYKLLGADQPATPIVFINGMAGSLEQWGKLQRVVAAFAPVLAYDRAGLGFSHGSRAHDGLEQAEELRAVLDKLFSHRKVVLVGYSTSASIARIFAARHADKVAGLLLLDPNLPEMDGRVAGRHNPFRTYFKPLLQDTVTTLFGARRLASRIAEWRGRIVLHTDDERRAHAVLLRFSHWWAVDREWLDVGKTSAELAGTMAPGSLGNIRLLLYTGYQRSGADEAGRLYLELLGKLIATTSRGELRPLGVATEHGRLLESEDSLAVLSAALRELANADSR